MATIALSQIRYQTRQGGGARTFLGGKEQTGFIREDASQTWKAGALLRADDDGDIEIAVGTEGTVGAFGLQAMEDAVGTEGSDVFAAILDPRDIYVANVYHATAASAVTARGQLGEVYGLKLVSGKWHVDIENTAESTTAKNACVRVIGFYDEDALGDVYGRVLVQFLEYSQETDGGSFRRVLQFA